jgi:hypothetical protein
MTIHSSARSAGQPLRWRSRLAVLAATAAAVTGVAAFPALTASASPAPAPAAAVAGRTAPSVAGAYTVYFSWGCTANYAQGGFTFNPNGTFTDSYGGAGTWAQINGTLAVEYNAPVRTAYVGTIDGNAGSGAMSTLVGAGQLTGCWFMTAAGTTWGPRHALHHGKVSDPQRSH